MPDDSRPGRSHLTMNRNLLILLDKTVFKLLFYLVVGFSRFAKGSKKKSTLSMSGKEHFLVIRPGGVGDGLMAIPLLRTLRERFPQAKISVLCVKKSVMGLQYLPFYDDIIVLDDLKKCIPNVVKLFAGNIDVVFDLEQFKRITSIVTFMTGAQVRIGFDTNNRRWLYTDLVAYFNDKQYETLNNERQLQSIGITLPYQSAIDIRFPLEERYIEKGKSILELHSINLQKTFVVAVFPGVLKPHHKWKTNEFISLVNKILEESNDTKVLIFGTTQDKAETDAVLEGINKSGNVVDLVGQGGFWDVLGLLKFCRIVVACDGGAVYMGAAMGCGTLSLWGPGVMERFKPPGDLHIGVRKDYSCIPCVQYNRLGEFPKCPYNRRCLNDLTSEEVFEKYLILRNRIKEKHQIEFVGN